MEDAPNICPYCLNDVTNGVGPSNLPEVTELLNNLPSSHIFRKAADWHDYFYHLGYSEFHRRAADEYFYSLMLTAVDENCAWYLRPWYRLQAYRNYWFVGKFGSAFFNYAGCSCATSKTNLVGF
jgi:hypothetical protein